MRFFFSPFTFILELVAFVIQAAFVYGLVLLAGIIFIVYMINDAKSRETIVEYVNVIEETVERVPELICIKLSGCKINVDAKTEEEYCPSCVMK